MRLLTISRAKSFTLSGRFYAAIGDDNGDIKINGVPCRIVGRLKNGGELSFEIPDGEVCVYVFETKHSREYTYDMYRVPAGEDDVTLTGSSYFNAATSSSFRFDNNETDEAVGNREKAAAKAVGALARNRLIGLMIGAAVILLFVFILWLILGDKPKTFRIKDASITLTDKFTLDEESADDYYSCISGKYAVCEIFKADPEMIGSADEAEEKLISQYGLKSVNRVNKDGLRYFTCSDDKSGGADQTYFDMIFIFEKNGVYIVWFMTPESNAENLAPDFIKFAKTFTIE